MWGVGKQTRNLIHAGDCVDVLLKMEESATCPTLILNLGNEKTTTIKELAETIVKMSGKSVSVRYDTSKPVGPVSRVPDISKAEKDPDWRPITGLVSGFRKTYRWIGSQCFCVGSGVNPFEPLCVDGN